MDKLLVDSAQLIQVKEDVENYRLFFGKFRTKFAGLEEMGEQLTANVDTLIRNAENPEFPVDPVEPKKDMWVTLYGLNIRSSPEVGDNKVDVISGGEVIEILRFELKANGDLWGKISLHRWIALKYQGNYLAEEI